MRIVNIIQRYPPAIGGAETWCQEVCRSLANKGHQVKVLTLDVNEEEQFWRPPLDSERTIAFGRLAFDRDVFVRRYRRSLPIHTFHHLIYGALFNRFLRIYFFGPHSGEMYGRMWREIRRADVVLLHTIPYPHNFIAFFLAKCFRKKVVIAPHFHPTHPHYERVSNYWLLRHCDAVITVSPFEKEYLERSGVANEKLFVTGNAIHPDDYKLSNLDEFKFRIEREFGLKPEDRVITFIGRKTPEKGVGHLIEVVRNLLPEMPLKLFLVGPGTEWYHKIYADLSPEEKKRIIDVGVIPHQDKVDFLHISDLLALPSRYEAFGIVFLEAWICGVPVLGTTEGAMPSVIGTEGFLCKFGDVEDMKATITKGLSDDNALKKRGKSGKKKVIEKYTWDAIGQKVEKAINSAYKKKKILICSNSYPPHFIGGAELSAHNMAEVFKKRGYDILVFTGLINDKKKRYSVSTHVYRGIRVFRVNLHSRDLSPDFFDFFHKEVETHFSDLLDRFSPDVIHFHNIPGLSVGLIHIAKHRKIKTVLTLHDYWGICQKNTLLKQEGRVCDDISECKDCLSTISGIRWNNLPIRMRKDFIFFQIQAVDTIICASRYVAKRYVEAGIDEKKICVIPCGINIERFSKIPREKVKSRIRFSYVGHLGRHKGIHVLVDALALLKKKDRIQINIIGDGELRDYLKRKVKAIGWDNSVRFWGKVDNQQIENVYRETDVLLVPSIWPEAFGIIIIEAMASGIPVIASRIGGIPEIIEDGKTGYLIEAGNAKELANKMSEFIAEPSKISLLGKNGFKKASAFSSENQANKSEDIYLSNQPILLNTFQKHSLILCLGKKMHQQCINALHNLQNREDQLFIFMADWVEDNLVQTAKVLWVVDETINPNDISVGLRNRLPLLVPEKNKYLKTFCTNNNCGLFYADDIEAQVCLEYLLDNEEIRTLLGINAFRAFYENSTH
jgi:glycosyltransferase involved in cell wall biosynthesis